MAIDDEIMNDARYVVVEIVIAARPEKIWRVLTDYGRVTCNFPTMTKLEILQDDGEVKTMSQQVRPLPPVPPISYVVEVKETFPRLLQWSGCTRLIKTNQGCIKLQEENDSATRVTFAAWAEAALIVPNAIVRYQMKKIIPTVLQSLKAYAEGTDYDSH